ncbi:hypothetical protein BCV69DRAFT_281331 [Microstroma glucosiphilum]|uniref:Uncharacterized protein n=1 Tax=Pseudomicrostroma glucosiphilum TaxID=1684307 RepID=A0A316UAT8_9BASI|nr:hypothetical protein BCV69DRAFT_281331 [Pseudomicrostroma glucosiphilum]PWN22327.1 hypothetical protein BCV69DRAFT_281331 [Pseudomicrostroma glucosiphilum]
MLIRQALPEEGEELFDFYFPAVVALGRTFPTPTALNGTCKAEAYLREMRLQRITSPTIYSIIAFDDPEEEGGKRGKIIGLLEFGPPSGYSPLGKICPWEILCLYTSGRGKGIALPLIKYALQLARSEGKLVKPPKERRRLGVGAGGEAMVTANDSAAPASDGVDQAPAQAVLGVATHIDNVGGRAFYTKIGGKRTPGVYDIIVSTQALASL